MTNPLRKARVTVYSKPGCHLCEEAKEKIKAAACETEYELVEINIELDQALLEQYRYDIPVVFINGVKAFKHRVEPAEFRRKVRRLRKVRQT